MTADHPAADQPPVATRKRNPSWARDELILALDLYLREGQLDAADPSVIELSAVLNALPIHTDRPDREKFRNPNYRYRDPPRRSLVRGSAGGERQRRR